MKNSLCFPVRTLSCLMTGLMILTSCGVQRLSGDSKITPIASNTNGFMYGSETIAPPEVSKGTRPAATQSTGFYVHEGRLYDKFDNDFVMRGINAPYAWFHDEALAATKSMVAQKFNLIRVVWTTSMTAAQLDNVLKEIVKYKAIPMVELHDYTGSTKPADLLSAVAYFNQSEVKAVLNSFQDQLLINIANEWSNAEVSASTWKEANISAIQAMRSAGFKHTLVIDSLNYAQDYQVILDHGADIIAADDQKNLVFSIHMYNQWNDAAKIIEAMTAVSAAKLPLVIGEFGYNYNNGENNLGARTDAQSIVDKAQQLGIGWIAWSWKGNNEENAWLDLAKEWDGSKLTKWGYFIINGSNGTKNTSTVATTYTSGVKGGAVSSAWESFEGSLARWGVANWGTAAKSVASSLDHSTDGLKSLAVTLENLAGEGVVVYENGDGDDLSAYKSLTVDIHSSLTQNIDLALALTTGPGWTWEELGATQSIVPGANTLTFDLTGAVKNANTGWQATTVFSNTDSTKRINFKFMSGSGSQTGTIHIDNIVFK